MIPRTLLAGTLRAAATPKRTINTFPRPCLVTPTTSRCASHVPHPVARSMSSKSLADEKIDEITELYATAQDEFEIAMDETEKVSVYAEEDRKAARDELSKVQEAYRAVLDGGNQELADEVQRRIGQRIRELEHGVTAMEELAQHQD